MNGTGNKPESNQKVIQIVIIGLVFNLTIGMAALGYCLVTGTTPDQTLLTAYVGLTGTLAGYVAGVLGRTSPTTATPSPEQAKPTGEITVPEQKLETAT